MKTETEFVDEEQPKEMSSRSRTLLTVNLDAVMANDPLRELFEACKTGDIVKVKKIINSQTVNARDTAGRKSTPLHFAAGKWREDEEYEFTFGYYYFLLVGDVYVCD